VREAGRKHFPYGVAELGNHGLRCSCLKIAATYTAPADCIEGDRTMSGVILYLASSEAICQRVVEEAKAEGIQSSQIQPAGSIAEALNAPITGSEIIAAAHVLAAMFSAGTAGIVFLLKLQKILKKGEAVVVQRKGRKRSIVLRSNTPKPELENYFEDKAGA
jgi:hypothetical protein